jgi:hypothetical protein
MIEAIVTVVMESNLNVQQVGDQRQWRFVSPDGNALWITDAGKPGKTVASSLVPESEVGTAGTIK